MTKPKTREIVGILPDRTSFKKTVDALLATQFAHSDLSVLSSHQSIEIAEPPEKTWKEILTALVGEMKYEGPIVASGAILLAGGATAAAAAGLIGAAVGGIALKELFDEVTSSPDTEDFTRSVEAGSIILWVHAETPDHEVKASEILEAHGARNVHLHQSK